MNQLKSIFTSVFVLCLIVISSAALYGQQVEPSYEISLQLVIGSSDTADRSELPTELAAVSRQLKRRYSFASYKVATTFLGRISNTGTFQYQSVANISGKEYTPGSPTFLDWSVSEFRSMPTSKGQTGFQAQSFRFGAKVPVVTGAREEAGKSSPIINYESIGLSLNKIGLSENVPTLIGTINLPGTSGTICLVMTVRSAD